MMTNKTEQGPTPNAIFDTAFAYQRSFALRAGVDLDVFTAIGEGHRTARAIAASRDISERGARILCDFLTTIGFLVKEGDEYALASDAAAFLDRRSPAYMGSSLEFLAGAKQVEFAQGTTEAVRDGTIPPAESVDGEHEVWTLFAHAMASLIALPAKLTAELADLDPNAETKVLDIAARHGEFGMAVARRFPTARIVAQDWPAVLAVARERALRAGLADRFTELSGDAFEVDFGTGYDLVLVPNFLHHFDQAANEKLLRKVAAALRPGGQTIIVEFVPNDDRVSPPQAARFALTMLTSTRDGDAFTFAELARMLYASGFGDAVARPLHPTPMTAVTARRK